MSASFPRVDNSPTNFVPPLGQPDPSANLGKLGEILNGPLDSGIQRPGALFIVAGDVHQSSRQAPPSTA